MLCMMALVAAGFASCSDNESYSDMLNDERHACNAFLANFEIEDVPADTVFKVGSGNADDMSQTATAFLYDDYSLETSSQWGYGMQMPLKYLGVDCEMNLVVKSQYGWTGEISSVVPYMYHLRYFKSRI